MKQNYNQVIYEQDALFKTFTQFTIQSMFKIYTQSKKIAPDYIQLMLRKGTQCRWFNIIQSCII
ncbi:MAG: hypothetical protein CML22_14045 [Rheinheimera sp.]|nr:hypothetical protein [Rheinheimera sp.]MBM35409.1 hypothetical protein [Rheinheimera sp.]